MDGQSIQKFEGRLDRELEQLHQELEEDRYQPRAVRRHWIDKGGGKKRPLGIPTVRDRVVQTSLRQVWSRSSKRSSAGTVMDLGRSEAVRMG